MVRRDSRCASRRPSSAGSSAAFKPAVEPGLKGCLWNLHPGRKCPLYDASRRATCRPEAFSCEPASHGNWSVCAGRSGCASSAGAAERLCSLHAGGVDVYTHGCIGGPSRLVPTVAFRGASVVTRRGTLGERTVRDDPDGPLGTGGRAEGDLGRRTGSFGMATRDGSLPLPNSTSFLPAIVGLSPSAPPGDR